MESSASTQEGPAFPEMRLRPVGVVRNKAEEPSLVVGPTGLEQRKNAQTRRQERMTISELVIDDRVAGALDGIEDFSHLLVLYWAHRIPPQGRSLTKVHPRGRDSLPLVGVFCTCSPARPNPICLTPVRLLKRTANVLEVEGLDALDGSPLIDIKPHARRPLDPDDVSVPEWWHK